MLNAVADVDRFVWLLLNLIEGSGVVRWWLEPENYCCCAEATVRITEAGSISLAKSSCPVFGMGSQKHCHSCKTDTYLEVS